jgi:hypothetical protein
MAVPKRGLDGRLFVGSSKESIEQAIEDAYNFARKSQHYPKRGSIALRVIDIYIKGSNPISEYIAVLGPSG